MRKSDGRFRFVLCRALATSDMWLVPTEMSFKLKYTLDFKDVVRKKESTIFQ